MDGGPAFLIEPELLQPFGIRNETDAGEWLDFNRHTVLSTFTVRTLLTTRAAEIQFRSKAGMQASRGRTGFDVTQGVVFDDDSYETAIPLLREGGVDAT